MLKRKCWWEVYREPELLLGELLPPVIEHPVLRRGWVYVVGISKEQLDERMMQYFQLVRKQQVHYRECLEVGHGEDEMAKWDEFRQMWV